MRQEVPMSADRSMHKAQPRSLPPVLWIGGAQWAGKTTVAWHLTHRYPLISYDYDYTSIHALIVRARINPELHPHSHDFLTTLDRDADEIWVRSTPEEMAARIRDVWSEKLGMVLDDLAALPSGVTVLAEGWGL